MLCPHGGPLGHPVSDKGPELWAYQTTILRAAHNYEWANWVAYDRQFRRDMLARKDLNWSTPNPRLYSEAFTGRAKIIPRCQHCLSEDHSTTLCPLNPAPAYMTWMPGLYPHTPSKLNMSYLRRSQLYMPRCLPRPRVLVTRYAGAITTTDVGLPAVATYTYARPVPAPTQQQRAPDDQGYLCWGLRPVAA